MAVADALLVGAVRTPVTRRGGPLAGVHSADLGASAIGSLIERAGIDPAAVDDVIFGCCDAIGPQAGDIARTSWLAAGLPDHVPGVTIDRQCGSSQQAVHFAAQAVMSGTADVIVAGGVQNMSAIPITAAMAAGEQFGFPDPFSGSAGWRRRYGDVPVSQYLSAEMIARKWGATRLDMEKFALQSHQRAVAAIDAGHFDAEVAAVGDVTTDTCPRRGTSLEAMAALPTLQPDGLVTAATSSQICDGSAALLVMSERGVRDHGVTPRARIHHMSVRGADPVWMLTAPIPATERALAKTGLTVEDIDLFEVNEAFAAVALAWLAETGADPARVNISGGAIALGHPIGATGARLMTTLLHNLERTGGRYGLQVMCQGGGQANVTIIERLG
jgi:acetyl-CoA C-acetyltransferase